MNHCYRIPFNYFLLLLLIHKYQFSVTLCWRYIYPNVVWIVWFELNTRSIEHVLIAVLGQNFLQQYGHHFGITIISYWSCVYSIILSPLVLSCIAVFCIISYRIAWKSIISDLSYFLVSNCIVSSYCSSSHLKLSPQLMQLLPTMTFVQIKKSVTDK